MFRSFSTLSMTLAPEKIRDESSKQGRGLWSRLGGQLAPSGRVHVVNSQLDIHNSYLYVARTNVRTKMLLKSPNIAHTYIHTRSCTLHVYAYTKRKKEDRKRTKNEKNNKEKPTECVWLRG